MTKGDTIGARGHLLRLLLIKLRVLDSYQEKDKLIQHVRKYKISWIDTILNEYEKSLNGIKN